jgi:hypothetical protein
VLNHVVQNNRVMPAKKKQNSLGSTKSTTTYSKGGGLKKMFKRGGESLLTKITKAPKLTSRMKKKGCGCGK